MLHLITADFSTPANTTNTVYFDNVQNQVTINNAAFIIELTSLVTEGKTSARFEASINNARFMTADIKCTHAAASAANAEVQLGTKTLPFGLYSYRIGFQSDDSANLDINNTTIFQHGLSMAVAQGGEMSELTGDFVEYASNTNTYAYTS